MKNLSIILLLMLSSLAYSQERVKFESISIEKTGVEIKVSKTRTFKMLKNNKIIINNFRRGQIIGQEKKYLV